MCPLLVFALAVQGCAGGVSSRDAAGYDGALARGDYKGAASFAVGAGQIGANGSSSNLLWSLNAGSAMVASGDGQRTLPVLDNAEAAMTAHDANRLDMGGQYRAKTYDGVMVDTYKAIAALQVGDTQRALVESKRASDRQRRAEEEFQAEINAEQSNAGAQGVDMSASLRAAQSDPAYRQALQDLERYAAYRPFINPFATYLHGLILLNTAGSAGEMEQARNEFQRVRGNAGISQVVNDDYKLADTHNVKFAPKTWVIFENGQSSTLSEYSLQVPIPIIGRRSGVSLVRVAMPSLHQNALATRLLLVGDAGTATANVGSFDSVQASEFKRRYPSILALAMAEVVAKALLQNVAAQEKSGIALLVTKVGSQISSADTRSWSGLPKEFQAARIEAPKNGQVRLRTAEGAEFGVATVPSDASSIVYVKAMQPGSPPSIQVLRF